MIKFIIAEEKPLDEQSQSIVSALLADITSCDWCVCIAKPHHQNLIAKALADLYPDRCFLMSQEHLSIGEIFLTETLPQITDPNRTCVINTLADLMIPTNTCKLLIEIITDKRQVSRDKYRHYQQQGSKPHVEHLTIVPASRA